MFADAVAPVILNDGEEGGWLNLMKSLSPSLEKDYLRDIQTFVTDGYSYKRGS